MAIPKEWLTFLREQYPDGSKIKIREMDGPDATRFEGTTGKLEHIDEDGRFHTRLDNGQTVALTIGKDRFSIEQPEPTTLEVASWDEVSFRCLDCLAPRLTEHIDDSTNIATVNDLAKRLHDMTGEQLTAYKALLEATACDDVRMAALLTDTLETYIFSPNLTCETDVARGELRLMLDGSAEELLCPYVALHRYGKALIEQQNLSLTSYGVIEHRDGQQIMSATNELRIRKGENDMNDIQRAMQMAQYYKDHYPPGTRIMLDSMENDPRPIEPGTKGTVKYVDDIGTLHCEFDNGRQLGICPAKTASTPFMMKIW